MSIDNETPDIKRFVLAPNNNWQSFNAGQFVAVRAKIDGIFGGGLNLDFV